MYFLLFYEVVDDYIERRRAFREEHLGLAREAKERGELVLAGAYADPADGAALVFRAHNDSVVTWLLPTILMCAKALVRNGSFGSGPL